MNKKKKKNNVLLWSIIGIFVVGIIVTFITLNLNKEKDNPLTSTGGKENVVEQKVIANPETLNEINEKETIYYEGEETATNEILFVFDYACPWCKKWEAEVFPKVEELIGEGTVKYRTQSMVYLNDVSLLLANFDQNVKNYYPNKYTEINQKIMLDGNNHVADWGTSGYLQGIIHDYKLDENKVLETPSQDSIGVTRSYTKALEIDSVPTVFVNGVQVNDAFNYNEIEELLKETK
uniref:Thioredoxin-like fold domain-containing protein n=1 Tax=Aeromonas sp. Ne-1 TaxID=1675689 RepID=A0A0H4JD28_9GAMM|nr:thioredoxin domain-containing protein [Aeromonas sp. Ne-1]AKO69692.1 hypothetical protein [Aeromonas sp. Ne-1]